MAETREMQLEHWVFASNSDLKGLLTLVKGVTFHQDQLAIGLSNDELLYLGALIKVAGIHGVDITVVGKCGQMRRLSSGENSKAGTPNKG